MRAKKSLGQHFLRSERALAKIIEAGDITPNDIVLEIGPGQGVLTERLLKLSGKVIAVEKDDELYELLQEKFKKEISKGQLNLIHDDILKFIQNSKLKIENYKLVANIPYNITGVILEKFLSAEHQPELMVLLVQKEVAERIVARDGKQSILSLSVKAYGRPKYIERVLAGSFAPAPQVDSAIIAITEMSKSFFNGFSEENFFKLLKAGFRSKRKKLISNLKEAFDKEKVLKAFEKLGLDENLRAEDADLGTWGRLSREIL